jgi:hypothetical protein
MLLATGHKKFIIFIRVVAFNKTKIRDSLTRLGRPADGFIELIISP